MCEIILFPKAERASRPGIGMIDVFSASCGKLGLDACVPASFADDYGVSPLSPGVTEYTRVKNESGVSVVSFQMTGLAPAIERFAARAEAAGIQVIREV